jgi:hypothetical protein
MEAHGTLREKRHWIRIPEKHPVVRPAVFCETTRGRIDIFISAAARANDPPRSKRSRNPAGGSLAKTAFFVSVMP